MEAGLDHFKQCCCTPLPLRGMCVVAYIYLSQALAINELSGFYCYVTVSNATRCSDTLPVELMNASCDW